MRHMLTGVLVLLLSAPAAEAAGTMAYVKDDGVRRQVQIAGDDGTGARGLETAGAVHLYPRLTADGRYVAFSEGADERDLRIVSMDLAGDELIEWTEARGWHLQARFSGNGKLLAYSAPAAGGGAVIEIIDVAAARAAGQLERIEDRGDGHARWRFTGTPRRIEEPGHKLYFPNLSSDGRFIVYHRTKDAARKELVLHDFETGETRTLTAVDGYAVAPALGFDDRYVAFGTRYDGQSDIARLDLRTGETMRLTDDAAIDADPSMLPDGSVSYSSARAEGGFGLFLLKADEITRGELPAPRPLVAGPGSAFTSSHSGDLAYRQGLLAPMTDPPRSSFGTVRVGDRIYVAGGHQGHEHTYPPESFLDIVEYYDVDTGTWHRTAPRSVACHGYSLAAHGKYVYAFGGFAYSADHLPRWKSLDLIERYDTEADRWEVVGRLPRPRSSYVLGVVDGKVYLIGGWDSTPQRPNDQEGRFHRSIDVFDLATEQVSESEHVIPDPLRRALSVVESGDEIILVGGLGVGASHFELLDQVTAFNPRTGAWRELPRLPFATFAPAAGVIGDTLYMFGGMFKTGPRDYRYVNHVFSYGLDREAAWRHTGRYLTDTKGFSMVVPLGDRGLAVLGGHSYDGETDAPVQTVEWWSLAD